MAIALIIVLLVGIFVMTIESEEQKASSLVAQIIKNVEVPEGVSEENFYNAINFIVRFEMQFTANSHKSKPVDESVLDLVSMAYDSNMSVEELMKLSEKAFSLHIKIIDVDIAYAFRNAKYAELRAEALRDSGEE